MVPVYRLALPGKTCQQRLPLLHPGLLAQVIVSKYCDHQPLYRQEQIYWRADSQVWLPRQSMARWIQLASEWRQADLPRNQRPDDEKLLHPGG